MFERKRKKRVGKPTDPEMLYSRNDIYFNSFLTELLDTHSLRVLHFILRKSNNAKTKLQYSYAEIKVGAEISCNNYVQKALTTLVHAGLVDVQVVKRVLTIQLIRTAKRIKL
jgi:hypothetical protein